MWPGTVGTCVSLNQLGPHSRSGPFYFCYLPSAAKLKQSFRIVETKREPSLGKGFLGQRKLWSGIKVLAWEF